MKYKNIVFDLFGTLVSDGEVIRKGKVLKEKLSEVENIVFVAHWRDWHKNNFSKSEFMDNIQKTNLFSSGKLSLIRERISIDEIVLFEDVLPNLEKLKDNRHSLTLLTNSVPIAKDKLDKKKSLMGLFDRIYWSFELGSMKPEKEIYYLTTKEIKGNKKDILFVGDTYSSDFLGPRSVGFNSILIDRRNRFKLPKDSIQNLWELIALV